MAVTAVMIDNDLVEESALAGKEGRRVGREMALVETGRSVRVVPTAGTEAGAKFEQLIPGESGDETTGLYIKSTELFGGKVGIILKVSEDISLARVTDKEILGGVMITEEVDSGDPNGLIEKGCGPCYRTPSGWEVRYTLPASQPGEDGLTFLAMKVVDGEPKFTILELGQQPQV